MKWRHRANGLLDGHRSPCVYATFPFVQGITRTQAQTEAQGNEKFWSFCLCLVLCLRLRSGRFNVEICTLTTKINLIIQQPVTNLSKTTRARGSLHVQFFLVFLHKNKLDVSFSLNWSLFCQWMTFNCYFSIQIWCPSQLHLRPPNLRRMVGKFTAVSSSFKGSTKGPCDRFIW